MEHIIHIYDKIIQGIAGFFIAIGLVHTPPVAVVQPVAVPEPVVQKVAIQEKKPVIIPAKKEEKKQEVVSPAPLQITQPVSQAVTPTPQIIVQPVIIQVPVPQSTPVTPTMAETTYTIKKGEDVVKTGTLEDVRNFTSDLNVYINWKKTVATATEKELEAMLQSNGYTLEK